jgi:hypothetical protein
MKNCAVGIDKNIEKDNFFFGWVRWEPDFNLWWVLRRSLKFSEKLFHSMGKKSVFFCPNLILILCGFKF